MRNDSLETLLLRHYGHAASTPDGLEQRLIASVRQEGAQLRQRQQMEAHLRKRRYSRRQMLRFVTLGTAGVGVVGVALDGISEVSASLLGRDVSHPQHVW
ncbi:hypothetical protein EI42_00772 [Thermosporothrix hazakensis]|jgi:hypothetical protein|uniref:Uncharacterized protein n=2 Tax=Thermosporothrix TaxID=768650 RepID=A0A326UEX9_THEHA|nr:hypothetical protein [Thermosporothrix hazakensis]PZW36594.1 hypothetical protein EI42_00772 [Thermosporothrix hazakensis]BBH89062.1 hypothetical protein KTC_38130 [Thermosporothrix sp. COM3]GCE47245.1 hypothetical protein KTH_21140 [Thermosporothrix hazakensis]